MSWVNDDGLVVYSGTEEANLPKVYSYRVDGPNHILEIDLDYSQLSAFGAGNFDILNDTVMLPSGVYINSVEIIPITTWVGAGATFDLGTVDSDDRTTEHDFDGFIVAATVAEMNAGGENVAGWVGALVGTVLSNDVPLLICADQDTATSTAGRSTIRITYHYPQDN